MCSVKHPCSEKDAEKLEKMQKNGVHILRPEQKPWTGFKGGENILHVVFNPRGKQRERGEWKADVAQVHGEMPTAAQCHAAVALSSSLPGKELVAKATDVWACFREAGKWSGLAGVHGCPPSSLVL